MSRTPSIVSSITAQQSVSSYIDPSRVAQLVLQLAEKSKETVDLRSAIERLTRECSDAKQLAAAQQHVAGVLRSDVEALPALLQKVDELKDKLRQAKKQRHEEEARHSSHVQHLTASITVMDTELTELREQYRSDTAALALKLRRAEAELGEALTDNEQATIKYELLHRRREEDTRQVDREKARLRAASSVAQGTQVEPATHAKLLQTEAVAVRSVGEQCELLVAPPPQMAIDPAAAHNAATASRSSRARQQQHNMHSYPPHRSFPSGGGGGSGMGLRSSADPSVSVAADWGGNGRGTFPGASAPHVYDSLRHSPQEGANTSSDAVASGGGAASPSLPADVSDSSHLLAGILRHLQPNSSSSNSARHKAARLAAGEKIETGDEHLYRRAKGLDRGCLSASHCAAGHDAPGGDDDVAAEEDASELVHRYHVEKQIRIHDKLLAAVSSLQREAAKSTRVPAPF